MYIRRGELNKFTQKIANNRTNAAELPKYISNLPNDIAHVTGFRGAYFTLVIENEKQIDLKDLLSNSDST